jgi:lysophospholipase L1-like esterase
MLICSQKCRFVGRVNPETNELTWPSTGVVFAFEGTTASIGIDNIQGESSVDLYIDDAEPISILHINSTSIPIPTLPKGRHTIELRKRSEAQYGTFRLTEVKADGKFLEVEQPKRRIEIIGDSISVGYGLDGTLPCVDMASVQNNPKTYGAVAAEALGADYSVVAWSGRGLTRNYLSDGQAVMPELYTRYGAEDADNSYPFPDTWLPDVVVINLGTNDFNYLNTREPVDPEDLTSAVVKLVEKIHSHSGKSKFFLVSSPMLNDSYPTAEDAQHSTHVAVLKAAIAQMEDVEAYFVDWPPQGSDVGCDYHPNAATHAEGAAILETAIRGVLDW